MIASLRAIAVTFLACICAGPLAAEEIFQRSVTPGGIAFWRVQRSDAPRTILVASFVDAFALRHPEKISAPIVGAALMRSGPKGMTSGEFSEDLKDIDARCGVAADEGASTFTVEAKPQDFSEGLALCSPILREPALRDEDIKRIRKSSKSGRERLDTNRIGLAAWLMRRLTRVNGPFAQWGEPEEVARIENADVDLWRREVFARDNLTLIVVGSETEAVLGELIDKSFAALPEHAAATVAVVPPPVYPAKTIVLERAGEQTALIMEAAFTIGVSEGPAVTIGNNILGGGMDRRLSRAVRGEQGATYGISSGVGTLGPRLRSMSIRSALANDLAAAGVERVREEYEHWRRNGVTDDEVAAARSSLATNFEKGSQTPGGKAFALLTMLRTDRTAKDEADYVARLRETTTDGVNRILREKLPAQLTTVIVAPKADGFNADCVIHEMSEIETCR